ncbi:hypothetical protein ACWGID_12020 [Kribbella sp. NPDC054772]
MSQVFGTERHPAYFVPRTDRLGNPVSLGPTLPESKAILFTGAPGMGKTSELDRAEDLAQRQGWTTIRLPANSKLPLEHAFTMAVRENLDELRDRFGDRPVGKLSRTVRDLTRSGRKTRVGWEGRFLGGVFPVELVLKQEKDTTAYDNLGTTLEDFADELGKLTEVDDKPILLLVDNVDKADEFNLAGLNELAIHIEHLKRPVWLIAAGGAKSTGELMRASRRMSGIATTITNQFDIRTLGPLSDAELRPSLTVPLEAAGIRYDDAAVDSLLFAANGDPSWLRDLGETALAYRHPQQGITVDVARAAIADVWAGAAARYEAEWGQRETNAAQKELLARVAAEGPNGLEMPEVTGAAGAGEWQDIDKARQELVARGLLREHDERIVTIPDQGFQDWVNDRLGQTPAVARSPEFGRVIARQEPALAPAHPTGGRALVNQVFGAAGALVHPVDRADEQGRPASLEERDPDGTTVLYTGPPGIGTSQELDRAQAMAEEDGWITIRLNASRRESMEARVIRSIRDQLDTFRAKYPASEVKQLRDILNKMAVRTTNTMNTAQSRFGFSPLKVGIHASWEGVAKDSVGTTLNEVGEHLGKMALPSRTPIMLMVDNLDAAEENDLVTLVNLSSHLRSMRQPMFLVAAGGEDAYSRLLTASGGKSGTASRDIKKIDVRKLPSLTNDQLRAAFTRPLDQAGVRYEPAAVENLVAAAEGNPTRLRTLAAGALEIADPSTGISAEIATTATSRLNVQSRVLYDAAWYNCTAAQKELLVRTAARGAQGIADPAQSDQQESRRWDLDGAANKLVARGLLTRSDHQIRVADPGFREWVQTRLGVNAAQAGIAHPVAPRQLGAGGERPPQDRPALGPVGGKRDIQANR